MKHNSFAHWDLGKKQMCWGKGGEGLAARADRLLKIAGGFVRCGFQCEGKRKKRKRRS